MSDKVNCVIIDDEPISLSLLEAYVARVPLLNLEGSYDNAKDAIQTIRQKKIDLVITDVRMPEITGMQLAIEIRHKSKVIFVSSFPEHAVLGFDLDAVDYLQKPFSFDRFLQAIQKLLRIMPSPVLTQRSFESDIMFVKTNGKLVRVELSKVLFVEARKEYVAINTSHTKLLTQQSMHQMQELLESRGFIRVHKSYIVAIDKIEEIERNVIKIEDNYIPIGANYKENLANCINRSNV